MQIILLINYHNKDLLHHIFKKDIQILYIVNIQNLKILYKYY